MSRVVIEDRLVWLYWSVSSSTVQPHRNQSKWSKEVWEWSPDVLRSSENQQNHSWHVLIGRRRKATWIECGNGAVSWRSRSRVVGASNCQTIDDFDIRDLLFLCAYRSRVVSVSINGRVDIRRKIVDRPAGKFEWGEHRMLIVRARRKTVGCTGINFEYWWMSRTRWRAMTSLETTIDAVREDTLSDSTKLANLLSDEFGDVREQVTRRWTGPKRIDCRQWATNEWDVCCAPMTTRSRRNNARPLRCSWSLIDVQFDCRHARCLGRHDWQSVLVQIHWSTDEGASLDWTAKEDTTRSTKSVTNSFSQAIDPTEERSSKLSRADDLREFATTESDPTENVGELRGNWSRRADRDDECAHRSTTQAESCPVCQMHGWDRLSEGKERSPWRTVRREGRGDASMPVTLSSSAMNAFRSSAFSSDSFVD